VVLVLSLLALGACHSAPAGEADWSYRGETGPKHWADLKPEYALAKTGRQQSPIDIRPESAVPRDAAPIEVSYEPTTMDVLNNGHTVEDDYHGGGHIRVDGHEYSLAQFHFHTPSEHTVDGQHYPMEMHLVHKDADGKLAVVSVLIAEGKQNAALGKLEPHVPGKPGRSGPVAGVQVNAADLLPPSLASYRYSGSLTTPPCSEGVAWFVLQQPIEASRGQLDRFHEIMGDNNRPTQPLNGRSLTAAGAASAGAGR
jgi:carbonic anhydrase